VPAAQPAGALLDALALADSRIVTIVKSTFRTLELQVRASVPTTPLYVALGLSCRRLATMGNEALGRWGLSPPHPRFPLRSAFVLQTACYSGKRSAWQVEAGPRFPLRSAFVLQTALGRSGLPPPLPHFPLRSAFVLQTARYRGCECLVAELFPPCARARGS
jgi:hypothetical protein